MESVADIRGAQTIVELGLHLSYLRRDLAKLVEASANMATKQDIEQLETRMLGFATKRELLDLEARLQKESLGSTFDRWLSLITRLGTAAAVLAGAVAAIAAAVHFFDGIKAVVPH